MFCSDFIPNNIFKNKVGEKFVGSLVAKEAIDERPMVLCRAGSLLALSKYIPLYTVRSGNVHTDLCYRPLYIVSMDNNSLVLLLENVVATKISTDVIGNYHIHCGWCKVLYKETIYWLEGRHIHDSRVSIIYDAKMHASDKKHY
jgi:hypothetical protein